MVSIRVLNWGTGLTSTADNTLRRKQNILQGDTNPNDAFDPSVEWDGYPIDTFDGLGSHTVILPVELTSFTAAVAGNNVTLKWHTATEVKNYGFDIERKFENGNYSKIRFRNW